MLRDFAILSLPGERGSKTGEIMLPGHLGQFPNIFEIFGVFGPKWPFLGPFWAKVYPKNPNFSGTLDFFSGIEFTDD